MAKRWTINTLKEHLEARLEAVKENAALALAASERAIVKAEAAAEKRADASNEIRGAMVDAQRSFATIQQFALLKEQHDKLESKLAAIENKSTGAGQLWAMLIAVVLAVAAINGVIFAIQGAAQ